MPICSVIFDDIFIEINECHIDGQIANGIEYGVGDDYIVLGAE